MIYRNISKDLQSWEYPSRPVLYDEITTLGRRIPDSNQRFTVGLRPLGKAFAQHAIESDAISGFALLAGNAFRIFFPPGGGPEKFRRSRWANFSAPLFHYLAI